jgi:CHAT domain-containing protein/Tfp pilus assembly protein PilF
MIGFRARIFLLPCSLFFLLLPSRAAMAQTAASNLQSDDMPHLAAGRPIERELIGGASHSYRIALAADQYLEGVVEQKGIDVLVSIFDPDGKKIAEVDSPNGEQGPEPFSFISEIAGEYRLEVRSLDKEAKAGRYQASIELPRAVQPQDKDRIAARKAMLAGALLQAQHTGDGLRNAIKKFEEALPHWRAAGERKEEADAINAIGEAYYYLSERASALDYFQQALSLYRAIKDRKGEASALGNIGASHGSIGEYQQALDYYNQALPIQREIDDRAGLAETLSNMGACYGDINDFAKALYYYEQALPLRREIGDRAGEANTLNNMATAYYSIGERDKAIDMLNQSLSISRALKNLREQANTLHNIGVIYGQAGDKKRSLDYLLQALPLRQASGDRLGEAYTMGNIGKVYTDLAEYEKALDYLQQTVALRQQLSDQGGEAYALFNIARVERARGNLDAARARMERVLAIVEELRARLISPELRATYFTVFNGGSRNFPYYEFYIDLLMEMHKKQPSAGHDAAALQVSESARARSLLDLLMEAGADIQKGVDADLLKRARALQEQINTSATNLNRLKVANQSEKAVPVEKELQALKAQFEEVEAAIRKSSPQYHALTRPQPISASEIQSQLLDADTMLLEYSLGDKQSFLWVVTANSINSYELPPRAEIEKAAQDLYKLMVPRDTRNLSLPRAEKADDARLDYQQAALILSRLILAPVANRLSKQRLLVVADGALQYIPFGALPLPKDEQGAQAQPEREPLIVEHEIVSLPSASTLAILKRGIDGRKPAARALAVIADPVFEQNDVRIKKITINAATDQPPPPTKSDDTRIFAYKKAAQAASDVGASGEDLYIPRLPGTRREADRIIALLPANQAKEALDFEASRATVVSAEMRQYRIIHFATHGFADIVHPELSGLLLSMFDKAGNPQDGFLRGHEIFNLDLPADLVVLSACETGFGKDVRGEGLIGLTRGFLYAGAARVVVSLWSVNDLATAELMEKFYQRMLKNNERPAAALRAAQIEMWQSKRWHAPFYWAAFQLQGDYR